MDLSTGGGPPVVSVIIPAYKSADVLPQTLATVTQQTFTAWEAIIVDDCSPDDIVSAIKPFADDPRIRLVHHAHNQGAAAARNTGIGEARGRFVAFLDADDEWHPDKLAKQVQAVEAAPHPNRVFCVTRTKVVVDEDKWIVKPARLKADSEPLDEFIFVRGGFCQTSSFFLSRDLAAQIRWKDLRAGEDHLFAIEATAAGSYLLIDELLTIYHDEYNPNRLSNDKTLESGRAFMDVARPLISQKALRGYEARYLGPSLLRKEPVRGLWTICDATLRGALHPRFALTVLLRTLVPRDFYQGMRARLLSR
ncbi:glycosyltransferase [Parvularcula bermudensis HTCC2503]|uniref:Glycosyltransferase n=1 Tax=Parvularcula bermudensis (strain ATCC BAA-594 / HTCC2503 / KCTC 12087) TaxID=314260 RepID=E0TI89_PARBH|nr:glycosyltransferase family 2 protein [Parvularcula bermudensis]ADM09428.1 glycosyltransferase [Parvularcula bermudensis HTCC2503]